MAPRNNPYATDPNIAKAFQNIADLFAPPTGADASGFAAAGLNNAKRQQLEWLFNNSSDPTAAARSALTGVQTYGNTPEGFNKTDATTRRGQDLTTAATTRGQDITAATSRDNNLRDNARAVAATRYGALSEGQVLPEMPQSVASMYGLPASGPVVGAMKLNQGQDAVTADGQRVEGPRKPLSETEMKAAILGQLPPGEQRSFLYGTQTPLYTQDGQGRTIAIAPGSAITDKTPVVAAPGTNSNDTEVTRLIRERDALPAGDPNRAAYDSRIAALGRGQQQSAYDKNNDESFAKLNEEIFTNATKAAADRGTYAALEAAVNNPNVTQGVLGAASLGLKKALNAFGMDAGSTGPAEMLQALGNQISLRLRDPSNGAGMPGALSDSDREFLRSMTISLGNSPDANRLLAQYYLASQQKALDLDGMRQQYIAKNGRIDEGFRTQMSDYLRNNDPTLPLRSKMSAGTQAVRVNSPADAEKLPPGTPIIWSENGKDVTGTVPGAPKQ